MDQGSVEYQVFLTLVHMTSTENRAPDLLILSPVPYPVGHLLPVAYCNWLKLQIVVWSKAFQQHKIILS